ncbi:MAG: hypothetical protein U1E53_00835 [Dongiaceae bacterium]
MVGVCRPLRRLGGASSEAGTPMAVIAEASQEVRSGIVYATFIVLLVFRLPLFAMPGQPGRMFSPLPSPTSSRSSPALPDALDGQVTPALACSVPAADLAWAGGAPTARLAPAPGGHWSGPGRARWPGGQRANGGRRLSPRCPSCTAPSCRSSARGNVYVTLMLRPGLSLDRSYRIGHLAGKLIMEFPRSSPSPGGPAATRWTPTTTR